MGFGGFPAAAGVPLPVMELSASVHRIEAEVANTEPSREEGLMFRRRLGPNRGMLFVFPQVAQHCMWMRNTYIPLSVAFIDDRGSIINIAEMQPQTETNHCAVRPARFALEMGAGWFSQRGIAPGQKLGGLDHAPPARW
jgi:uncharacterized membrane protein (UPF0127 family)